MNHTEFFKRVKQGDIARVYLFTGEENYTKRRALKSVEDTLLMPGLEALNENLLEGMTAEQIVAACETLPMMSERRLVVVRDYAPLMAGKSRDESSESARLTEYLPRVPESCCLIFYMRGDVDGRKALALTLKKSAECVEFGLLGDAELNAWVARELKAHGKMIRQETIAYLAFTAGRDLTLLSQELTKLVAYCGERAEVTEDDIRAVVTPSLECTVFQLVDKLLLKDVSAVYKMLNAMLESGDDRIRILAMITRQMRLMTHAKLMKQQKLSDIEVQKQLGLSPYALRRMLPQLKTFSLAQLEGAYKNCADAEYAIKNGAMRDEAALDRLILGWSMA